MELFEEIRRGYAAGETIQGLATKHRVHHRMVRQAICQRDPARTKEGRSGATATRAKANQVLGK